MKSLVVSEVVSLQEFYIQDLSKKDLLNQITHELSLIKQLEVLFNNYDLQPLSQPVKQSTLCVSLYYDDQKYYRAEIIKQLKNNRYLVRYYILTITKRFIDYGNQDVVDFKDLGKLPESLSVYECQA